MADDLEVIAFTSPGEFRAWLEREHATARGVWVKAAKAASGIPSITWNQGVDEAICFGWIDGQAKGIDDTWYLQRYTPRSARSKWSKVNRERVERLTAAGLMHPAGLAEVERATADGRWHAAYDPPSRAAIPDDLQAALDALPGAAAFFAGLSGVNRYAILHRVQDAKRPETRARRIAKFAAMCAAGETVH